MNTDMSKFLREYISQAYICYAIVRQSYVDAQMVSNAWKLALKKEKQNITLLVFLFCLSWVLVQQRNSF